ncbi:protein KAKU4-like isoform X2 [Pyrus x bretschneideri]|uniref:protein KAKU4-like isoform X2 n=1 Tax=Pyrus x bretschneideri TaxID=225117 RepID=UPI00202F803F|nr:protein KAKU4-like isoform X2 [Pyrus x bretschneideri]
MDTTATATTSRSRRALDSRSGGKIFRPRRSAGARTPYGRPRLVNPAPPENPNWFSRLIYSPTRKIASGAGKIISSVFGPDSSSSSSSSSEDGADDDDDEDISMQEDDGLNKRNGTSEEIKFLGKEPPSTLGKSDNKHVIEQLLIQETFSREECGRLIKIIKSRVVGFTNAEDAENTRPDVESPAMEAKKWLSEKRLGSTSKPVLDHGTHTLSSLMFPQGGEDEGGSPVDVAKVYMRARPSWASPSIKHGELRSPSSIGMQRFDEETPYSTGGNSAPTSKPKRDAPASGSWNIQEEIRRVRSKATEELLRSLPSTRIDWSASALEKRSVLGSLPGGQREDDVGDKLHNCKNAIELIFCSFSFGEGRVWIAETRFATSDAASMDGKGTQNALEEMFSSGQRLEASEYIKTAPSDAGGGDFDGHKDTSGSEQQNPVVGGTIQDSKLHDATCSMTEVTASRSAYTANGFPSSVAGLSARLNTAENSVLNGESNPVSSSHEIAATDLTLDDIREFLNEPTVEVTNINENDIGGTKENDGAYLNEATVEVHELIENYIDVTKDNDFVASGSQNSYSMPDDLSQELTQPSPVAKTDTVVEKQKGKRLTRYNRRGRSRGK